MKTVSRHWYLVLATAVLIAACGVTALTIRLGHAAPSASRSTEHYVIFTFDTEEDWNPYTHYYYNSYQYITSGVLYQLADGLTARGISALFFVTPNVARDMPEAVRYLQDKDQTIGVHLHPHNFVSVDYPYGYPYNQTKGEELNAYSYAEKLDFMTRAKEEVEKAAGNKIRFYRSGKFSTDDEIEGIAKDLGYKAVANHLGTYLIEPLGIWNLGKPSWDILDSDVFTDLGTYKRQYRGSDIVFSGHPMRLYDLNQGKVNQEAIDLFFKFVDSLNQEPNVEIVSADRLLEILNGGNQTNGTGN